MARTGGRQPLWQCRSGLATELDRACSVRVAATHLVTEASTAERTAIRRGRHSMYTVRATLERCGAGWPLPPSIARDGRRPNELKDCIDEPLL